MSVRVLARNALSSLSAHVIANAVGFAVNVLLVRHLGVERLGRYTYVTTYAALFGIVSSLGLYLVLARDVAGRPAEADIQLGAVLRLQAFLSPLALALTAGTALLFHSTPDATLIALAGVGVVLSSVGTVYGAVVTGQERIHLNAMVSAGMAVLWGLFVLGLVASHLGVTALIGLFVVHKLANALVLRRVCRRACGVTPRHDLPGLRVRAMLEAAMPFALALVLNDLYWNVGTILLGRLEGIDAVGTFSAAFRVVSVPVALVGTVSGVLYPRFSHLYAADPKAFAALVGSTRKYSLAIGIPLGLTLSFLSHPLVGFLFGREFSAAGGTLQLLGWFVTLVCLYSPLSYAMIAMQAERTWVVLLAAATAVLLGGSLLLVPVLGHLGLAASFLASGVLLVVAVPLAIRAKGTRVSPTGADLKTVGACGAMGALLWALQSAPALALVTAIVAYVVILHLAGFLTAAERRSLRAALLMPRER